MTTSRVTAAMCLTIAFVAGPVAGQTVSAPAPAARPVLTTATTTSTSGAAPTTASASTPTSIPTDATAGAYDRLSIGNRKIVRALYEAQQTPPPTEGGTMDGPSRLSLDEIAAMKQSGGWGQVFRTMQARGLVAEKNLGQVISQYNHAHKITVGETTTAANRVANSRGDSRGPGSDDGHGRAGGGAASEGSPRAATGHTTRGAAGSGSSGTHGSGNGNVK